jgi:polar amino acid transport system substrate-binding protein
MQPQRRLAAVGAAVLALTQWAAAVAGTPDPRVADIVRVGTVRVGLFLPQYVRDPATGELRGVWAESARALAARMGVAVVLLEHSTPMEAVHCLKSGGCDLLFLPLDSRSRELGDFSPPILQFDYTLLVPAGSAARSIADVDQPGARIAAVRNHASTHELARRLMRADLIHGETPDRTFELLRSGQAVAMASARPTLLVYSQQLPGAEVLADGYGLNINRMVVPKGRAGWLAYVSEFVEEAKMSGLVQSAIDRVGPRGIMVAPAGDTR